MSIPNTSSTQLVTLTLYKLEGFKAKWWGFSSMQFGHQHLKNIHGLSFYKLLGSGGGNGFSISPNWGVYGLLCVWDDPQSAKEFQSQNMFFKKYQSKASEHITVDLRPVKSHGAWSGVNPFRSTGKSDDKSDIAVITRATIKPAYLWKFWKYVPSVSENIKQAKGRKLSLGIGEWPLIQQATFSIWDSEASMMAYAYQGKLHSEVIKKTRELGWYSEELFARFEVLGTKGSWKALS